MNLLEGNGDVIGRALNDVLVRQYIVQNRRGMVAKFISYGATLAELHVTDRKHRPVNVVLGFDNLAQYLGEHPWFGSTIGRVANRIAGGKFVLDGVEYELSKNDGSNTLHGGTNGFDKQVWQGRLLASNAVRFSHISKHLGQGFPGNVNVSVTYGLTDENELVIEYFATCDQATPVNLTHHSYFNLAGAGKGNICDHQLFIASNKYTAMNDCLIPTGEIQSTSNTHLDFSQPTALGLRLGQVTDGYDLNYVLESNQRSLKKAATLVDLQSNRSMEVWTTQPGLQVYTANSFDGSISGIGGTYDKYAGIALEAQHFPDSVNQPHFPNTILRPNQTYREKTIYKFKV